MKNNESLLITLPTSLPSMAQIQLLFTTSFGPVVQVVNSSKEAVHESKNQILAAIPSTSDFTNAVNASENRITSAIPSKAWFEEDFLALISNDFSTCILPFLLTEKTFDSSIQRLYEVLEFVLTTEDFRKLNESINQLAKSVNESHTSVNGQLWTLGSSLHTIGDHIDTMINDPLVRTLSIAIDELNSRTKEQMMPKLNTLSLWHDSTLFFIESVFQEIKKTGKITTPAKEFVRRVLGLGSAEFVSTGSEDNSDDGEAGGPSAAAKGKQKADDEESDRTVTTSEHRHSNHFDRPPSNLYEPSTPPHPNPSNPNPSNHFDRPASGAQSVQMVSRKRSLPPASTSTSQSQSRPRKSSRVEDGQVNIVPSAGIEPPTLRWIQIDIGPKALAKGKMRVTLSSNVPLWIAKAIHEKDNKTPGHRGRNVGFNQERRSLCWVSQYLLDET